MTSFPKSINFDPRHQREGASDGKNLLWRHIAPQIVPGAVAAEARLTDFQPQIAVTGAHAPNSPNVIASGLRSGWPRSACASSNTTNVKELPAAVNVRRTRVSLLSRRRLVTKAIRGSTCSACRPMKCGIRKSPCSVLQPVPESPGPPSGAPTVCAP